MVEVGLDEAVDPLLHAVVGHEVDAGDVVPRRAQLLSEHAVGAAEVEDPTGPGLTSQRTTAARATSRRPSLARRRSLANASSPVPKPILWAR